MTKHTFTKDQIEAWLDDNSEFAFGYFVRKATQSMVNAWLADRVITIAADAQGITLEKPTDGQNSRSKKASTDAGGSAGKKTPMRKISHEDIHPRDLPVKPMVSTDKTGSPIFYAPESEIPNIQTKSKNSRVAELSQPLRRISHYRAPAMIKNQSPKSEKNPAPTSNFSEIDERDMIMELVRDIAMDLDVTSVSHRILQNVSILLDADRCSLFLMREKEGEKFLISRLFDVNKDSQLEENVVRKNEIKIKLGQGIAGMVAMTGNSLNIPDAYKDKRFNQTVDKKTGYKTRCLLCMPIKDGDKKIVGVAQVINKKDGVFSAKDEKIFASYLGFCGIAIHNAQLFEKVKLENRRNEVLLDLARVLFEEQSSLSVVMETILTHTVSLLGCERASILLTDPTLSKSVFTTNFEHVSEEITLIENVQNSLNGTTTFSKKKVPFNLPITSYVRQTGKALNITTAADDKRFTFQEDADLGFTTRSLLCVPIRDRLRQVIGVIQLINKKERFGHSFAQSDEEIIEAFAIFCGLGISNTRIYEETARLAAKQQVVLEILSYHAVVSPHEAKELACSEIRSAKTYNLLSFSFDDGKLTETDTLRASVRMFIDLNLVEKFHIDLETLCRWVESVKKNYRNVRYHNWRHAFNVCQSIFCMIKSGGLSTMFNDIERLALIISCLSHDLDHRGTNNDFQAKIEHPLARLYSTSTLEHHHFNQCLMLLQSEGCEILSHLSPADYAQVIKFIRHAILSTDLAIYFRKRNAFFSIVNSGKANFERNHTQRELLRGMILTATDVAAITKPWPIQYKVAQLVAEEFFEQGDIEKNELHREPIDMMNRNLRHKLPTMQIGFIDSVCLPLYKALGSVSQDLQPMTDGCLLNRQRWNELAKKPQSGVSM